MEKHCRWIYLDNFHLISVYKAITIDNKSSRMCPKKTGSEYFFHLKKLCVFHQNHLSPSSHEEETDAEQQQKTIRRASIFLLRLSHFFSHTIYLSLRIRILFRCFHTKCAMDVCVCVQESSMLNESERKSRMSDCGYNECHIFIVVSSGLNWQLFKTVFTHWIRNYNDNERNVMKSTVTRTHKKMPVEKLHTTLR